MSILFLLFGFVFTIASGLKCTGGGEDLKKIGCYKRMGDVFNERLYKFDWLSVDWTVIKNFGDVDKRIVCDCSVIAKKKGYIAYATRDEECFGTKNETKYDSLITDTTKQGSECYDYEKKCRPDHFCIGLGDSQFVYFSQRLPVDGQYGPWSAFSSCSKTCGTSGRKIRTRKCDSPAPSNGGKNCVGFSRDDRHCNYRSCPIPLEFLAKVWYPPGWRYDWVPWENLRRKTVNVSSRLTIDCTNKDPKATVRLLERKSEDRLDSEKVKGSRITKVNQKFIIDPVTKEDAAIYECFANRTWYQAWPDPHRLDRTMIKGKLTVIHPVDGQYSHWSPFSVCSKPCQVGTQNPPPANGGKNCVGKDFISRQCNKNQPCGTHYRVISEGCDDPGIRFCGESQIYLDNSNSTEDNKVSGVRGLDFVIIRYNDGRFLGRMQFDSSREFGCKFLYDGIKHLDDGTIVLGAAREDATKGFDQYCAKAIALIGGNVTVPPAFGYRGSYAIVGYKGEPKPAWVRQAQAVRKEGPTVLTGYIRYALKHVFERPIGPPG